MGSVAGQEVVLPGQRRRRDQRQLSAPSGRSCKQKKSRLYAYVVRPGLFWFILTDTLRCSPSRPGPAGYRRSRRGRCRWPPPSCPASTAGRRSGPCSRSQGPPSTVLAAAGQGVLGQHADDHAAVGHAGGFGHVHPDHVLEQYICTWKKYFKPNH